MIDLLLVAAGGAVGASARYGLVLLIRPHSPTFPTGTLVVNVVGCLAIGLLAGAWAGGASERARLLVFTGILGGFTTFSSFGLEFADLLREGRAGAAALHALLMNGAGLLAAVAGLALGSRFASS